MIILCEISLPALSNSVGDELLCDERLYRLQESSHEICVCREYIVCMQIYISQQDIVAKPASPQKHKCPQSLLSFTTRAASNVHKLEHKKNKSPVKPVQE
eukprot:Platyproteum_vivax@DN14870_c0_g1_i1.p1